MSKIKPSKQKKNKGNDLPSFLKISNFGAEMKFSIVIPTFNNLHELKRCLQALEKSANRDFDVLICADGSTDGTLDWLATFHPTYLIQILSHPVNRGRAANRNQALEKVSGEFLVFLDSDMTPDPEFLNRHLDLIKNGNSVSIGGIHYENANQNPWARYISERGVAKSKQGEEVPWHYFITANVAFPAKWWLDSGGFDEGITGYGGEDMEMAFRIRKKFNPKFVFNPAAKVSTVQDKTLDQALKELHQYGKTGLPYITGLHPELMEVYHLKKVFSLKFKDLIFEFLTLPGFRLIARMLQGMMPWGIRKQMLNYLVISWIHQGFRDANQRV